MQVPGEWYESDSPFNKASLSIFPSAKSCLILDFSSLLIPVSIGPPGTNAVGRCPNFNPPINNPGTILSHIPKHKTPSNIL